LQRVMPLQEAFDCARHNNELRNKTIHLKPIQRPVTIRLGTSDLRCLEKIFLNNEYRSPFLIAPKFIVDAGANIGMATLFFAQEFPDARIVAIEPEHSNFCLLKKNCEHLPNVTLINAALWSSDSEALTIADPNAEKWAISISEADNKGAKSGNAVAAITIVDLLKKFSIKEIDILKIDIEGAEKELFNTNSEAWIGRVGQIIVELHDRFSSGCSMAFYKAVTRQPFSQEIRGENIFVRFGKTQ